MRHIPGDHTTAAVGAAERARRPSRRGLRAALAIALLVVPSAIAPAVSGGGVGTAHASAGTLLALGAAVRATAGTPYSGTVAGWYDADLNSNAGAYSTSINWGDGSPADTSGTIIVTGQGNFVLVGNHDYLRGGSFPVTVTIADADGDSATATGTATVSCTTASSATSAYTSAVLADAPLGFWRLDGSCASVADSSGHGLTGQAFGGTAQLQPGAPTSAALAATGFDGASGYISLGDPAALQPAQLSVEAWINTTHTGSYATILRKRYYGYGLALTASGQPIFGIDDSNAIPYTTTGTNSVADGRWHYLVGTYDGRQVCLYVDGALAAPCQAAAPIFYQPDLVAIGRDGGYAGSYFSGLIDDVAIYGTALTQAQVQAHYAAVPQASPPVRRRSPANG